MSEPVRRYEFELFRTADEQYKRATDRRLELLEGDVRALRGVDEANEHEQAVEVRERRRWSWQEIVVAAITAAGVIAAAALSASH